MTAKKTDAAETKRGKFAQLEREAMADYTPGEPYVIDDVEPPIVITEPVETERLVAIMTCVHQIKSGIPEELVFEPMLQAVCGKAFDRVWNELLRDRHIKVTGAFIDDVRKHFAPNGLEVAGQTAIDGGASELPGGSAIS